MPAGGGGIEGTRGGEGGKHRRQQSVDVGDRSVGNREVIGTRGCTWKSRGCSGIWGMCEV